MSVIDVKAALADVREKKYKEAMFIGQGKQNNKEPLR